MSPTGSARPSGADPLVAELLARCAFPEPASAVTCAVSGGADSTALLALALAAELSVRVVHVDHGVRADSHEDARRVVALCERWQVPATVTRVELAPGPDLEARARAARRGALPAGALHGHTADDQAETVLLRLLRGTGPHGLAAMSPETHPLLGLRRHDTVALCRHLALDVVSDPSNLDPRFTRNRVRHEVLPLLDDVAGRDVVPLLARLASLSAEQLATLQDLSATLDPTDARAVAAAPRPVASTALRSWWALTTGEDHPPDHAALQRVLAVASGELRSCDVARGWRVARTANRLRLEHPGRGAHGVPPEVQG